MFDRSIEFGPQVTQYPADSRHPRCTLFRPSLFFKPVRPILLGLMLAFRCCPSGGERSFAGWRTIVRQPTDNRSPPGGQLIDCIRTTN
ncbi:hypothetical protein PRABACTJOHN_02545 [Parabacteroides johnsonii DSM 18315]|uniref:Uncharacterized protein n=1 Tax=Parabacteroides johnsonii DSM 18315 TaxID=537006 RepID=B7BBY3_9BACT|nr:hypothetical protein PRABACTJOHN_02545 [Parabacteroides johnsonii DSM 18315]